MNRSEKSTDTRRKRNGRQWQWQWRTDEEDEECERDGHEGHRVAHENVHRLLHVRQQRERQEAGRVRHPVEPARSAA